MRKILCCLMSLLMLLLCACGDKDSSKPTSAESTKLSFEDKIAQGIWDASYGATYDYKALYTKKSPFKAVGENLIENTGFDTEKVEKGDFALNTWVEQGEWNDAYTISTTGGLNGTTGMVFKQPIIGEADSYVGYMLAVKPDTRYVLTAKITTRNGSKPLIKVVAGSDKRTLTQGAGGYDDAWEQLSLTFDSEKETRVIILFVGNAVDNDNTLCKNGTTLLDDVAVYEAFGDASSSLADTYHVDDKLTYESFDGGRLSAENWGIADLWWHSNARAFYYNAVAEVQSEDSGYLTLRGRRKGTSVGYYGLEFTWENKLKKGYAYKFTIDMPYIGENPDIITVNDKIVWSQQYDKQGTAENAKALEFVYVCEKDEYARVRFICETCIMRGESLECSRRMIFSPNGDWSGVKLQCSRAKLSKAPEYKKYDLDIGTEFLTAGEKDAARMLKTSVGAAAEKIDGLSEVEYKTSDVDIFESSLNIMTKSGFNTAKKLKIDTLTYNPSAKDCANFDKWAKRAKDAGVKNLIIGIVTSGSSKNTYTPAQLSELIKSGSDKLNGAISATAELANKWLKLVSSGKVIITLENAQLLFGCANGGIENSPVATLSGFESIKSGGLHAYHTAQDYLKSFKDSLIKKLDKADKVKFSYEASTAGFDLTNLTKGGSDMVLSSGVNRSNYNIALAAARGAGNTAGLPYGVVLDAFDGLYQYGISNEAVHTGFLSLFHGGSKIIKNNLPVHAVSGDAISTQGSAWYDGVRYAKAHPAVGKTVVNTAIVRGEGDEWFRIAANTAGSQQSSLFSSEELNKALSLGANVPTKWAAAAKAVREGKRVQFSDTYLGDYSLLDVIFSKFGNAGHSDTERLFTGTPYGPADIISDTVSLETLQSYKNLIYCGRGQTIDKKTAEKLEDYVKKGGNLIIAAGQLKDSDGNLVVDEFAGISLLKQKTVDSLPYTYLKAKGARVIKKHKNGDPQALYKKTGKGSVALFSGEYLSSYDTEAVRDTIAVFLTQNADIKFSESADNIEFIPNIKGKSIIIPFINQGRGYYPSGNGKDNGTWTSNVSVNVESFGLVPEEVEVYRVLQSVDGTTPVSLSKIKFSVDDETVIFNVNVAIIDEIVIAPKGRAEKDFFS